LGLARLFLSSRRRTVAAASALHFLAQHPNFRVASKDGFSIGPGKRRTNVARFSNHRAGRGVITQVCPLKIEGVSAVDPYACQGAGSRAAERNFGPLVAINVEEGNLVERQDHGAVTC